jgi:hypothetical protein
MVLGLAAIVLFSTKAHAAGFRITNGASFQESSDHLWTLNLRIDLAAAPPTPSISMRFVLTEDVHYEHTINTPGGTPELTKHPLDSPKKVPISSIFVDFTNATGKIMKSTNFVLDLRRDSGLEGGEYFFQVQTSDGTDVGPQVRITLNALADQDIVDRSSMDFGGKIQNVHNDRGDAGTPQQVAQNDTGDDNSSGTGPVSGSGSASPMLGDQAFQKQPEENGTKPPHACGCSVVGERGSLAWGAAAPLGALAHDERGSLAWGAAAPLGALAFLARRRKGRRS